MIYREIGNTGINASVIGFGGMRFRDQENRDECADIVYKAYDRDINYFDTAIGYGKSEELFGEAFKEMKKTRGNKPFYVSSKTFAKTADAVRHDLETSLARMGLDYLDVYHVWCVMSLDDYYQRKSAGVLDVLEKLKEEGLIKHIAVSTHMTGGDVGVMMKDYPFEGVLLGYSAMNFAYREKGLDAASRLNRGVIVMNPLGGGLIPRNPRIFDFIRCMKG